jgi:hypothetical protein
VTTLDEPHEDAFFRAGSEGTYEGGPGTLVPIELEDWVDAPSSAPGEEELERRRRLQRVVVGIVATLSVSLFLAVALRSASSGEGDERRVRGVLAPSSIDLRASGMPSIERPAQRPAGASAPRASAGLEHGVTEESGPKHPQPTGDARRVSTQSRGRALRSNPPEAPRHRSAYESGTGTASGPIPRHLEPPTANFPDLEGAGASRRTRE